MKRTKSILKMLTALLLTLAVLLPLTPRIKDAVMLPVDAADEYIPTIDTGEYALAPVYNDEIYNELKAEWIKYEYARTSTTMSIGPLFRTNEYPHTQMAWGYSNGGIYNMITGTKVAYDGVGRWTNYATKYDNLFSQETVLRIGANSFSDGFIRALSRDEAILATVKKGYADVDYASVEYLETGATLITPYAVAIDNKKPELTSVSMSGFGGITLYFSETLRPANGTISIGEYSLQISYGSAKSGEELGTLTYRATSFEGNMITFTLEGPAPESGEYRILGIKGSSNGVEDEAFEVYGIGQVYAYSQSYDKYTHRHTMVYEDNPLRFIAAVQNRAPITDLAGNALSLPVRKDLYDLQIIIDTKSPSIEKISMTGTMSPKLNEQPRDSWPDLIDLSALYAGNDGDELYFDVYFTEQLRQAGSITLNVKKNGVSVTLENPQLLLSTNANGDTCTVARYGPFKVSEGMTMAEGCENDPIRVIAISGSFTDTVGNSLSGDVPRAAQMIYLDATAPTVTSSLYSGNGTREFSIKIEMSDAGSGFLGLEGKIGLTAKSEGNVSYKMAITDSLTIPDDSAYTYFGTFKSDLVSWQTIPLYNGTRYIHIKLLGNENTVTVDALMVEYSLPDYAGNKNTTQSAIVEPNFSIDEVAPKINDLQASVAYTDVGATVTADWSATDYNGNDGITTYYQWRETEPLDYSTGWISAGQQTGGFAWTLPESGQPQFSGVTDTTLTLWVYAVDMSGNRSKMVSKTVNVLLDKPNFTADLLGDPRVITDDPALKLSVAASSDGVKEGYMRAFISFLSSDGFEQAYSYTYAVIISSADPANGAVDLLPLTSSGLANRSVYRFTMNADESEIASDVTAITAAEFDAILSRWYGEVRVWFDLAYGENATVADNPLTPGKGALSALVADGSYYREDEEIVFRSSCAIENLFSAKFENYIDADGVGFAENKLFYQTLRGVSLDLTISNIYRSEQGIRDVDFNESYISVLRVNSDGSLGSSVATIPLSAKATQKITLPAANYTTAAYVISLTLATVDGQRTTIMDNLRLVVDSILTTVGVTETYHTPNLPISSRSGLPTLTRFDENGMPYLAEGYAVNSNLRIDDLTLFVIRNRATEGYIKNMTVSMAGQRESVRSDTYTNEVGGVLNFGFTVEAASAEQTVEGFALGKIATIYVWNPAIHQSREQGILTTDGYSFTYRSENAIDHDTWTYDAVTGIGSSTLNKNGDGIYTMAELIGLTDGNNVICYQVVMENGLESPVGQFTLYVTSETPSASLGMSVLEEKLNLASSGQPQNVARADISLQNIFATGNIVGTYYLTKDIMGLVSNTENGEAYTEAKYSQIDTLNALNAGYYKQWPYKNFVMYNANYGIYTDALGNEVSNTGRYLYYQYANYYRMYPVDADATVRLTGDYLRTYMTSAEANTEECVTYKMGDNMYAASGAFLIVDESGACALIFPQLAPTEGAYSEPVVEGYQPKYRLTDSLVEVQNDFAVSPTQYNIRNGRLEMSMRVTNGDYVDKDISYVVFTNEQGRELARFYLDGSSADPNPVGYENGSVSVNNVSLYLINPLADGVTHQVGDAVETVWAQIVLYDANTGRELRSNIAEVKHSERTYENPVPEPYWTDKCDGLRLNWDTSVIVAGVNNFNQHLKIFEDGDHKITVTDMFGVTQTVTVTTTHFASFAAPKVEIDNTEKTTNPVTVTFTIPEGAGYETITVISKSDNVIVEGSGSEKVTVTFKQSASVTVSWDPTPNDDGDEDMSYELKIDNILPVELAVRWDYGENAADYMGGDVIAYVYDKYGNWDIIDPMTGKTPIYTFVYGSGVTEYTFEALSNGEPVAQGVYCDLGSFKVTLEVEMKEIPTPPAITVDTRAPSVQIIPYAMRNQVAVSRESYLIFEDREDRVQSGDETYIDILNPSLIPYESYTAYTDSAEFTESLGWASRFRFHIEVQDVNKTRIVIKRGLYAQAPESYLTATSDVVENVMLLGNTLEVTGPAQFTIFVIDENGNVTAFSMDLYNVGNAPVPSYTKLPAKVGEANAIRVSLTAPAEGSDLLITAVDGSATNQAIFTENGSYTISYSYVYKGEPIEGTLLIEVTEIDNDQPSLVKKKWSVASDSVTQNDVILTLTFDKPIDSVRVGLGAAEIPEAVKVLAVGNTVTLRYSDNCDALQFCFRAFNGMWSDPVTAQAVQSIDRTAPVISVGEIVYSDDARVATVTFTSNETVSFRDGGSVGTEFTRKLNRNGSYEYTFRDAAGNSATVTVSIQDIVDTLPTLAFCKNSDGSGAVATPDELGRVEIGDLFYVSVDRDATVSFNGETYTVLAGEWLSLEVGDRSGGSIYAKDGYGNTVGAVFTSIGYPDLAAPTMELDRYMIHVSLLDLSGLDDAVKANAKAVDDIDGNLTVEVEYETPTKAGDYTVKYTARDKAGNETVMTGIIRVSENSIVGLQIDGNFVERESIYLASSEDELKLTVDMKSEPYTLCFVQGIRTAAQMKIGANELETVDGNVVLPFAGESGYYTILVTTQSHDNYRVVIYVK